MSQANEHSSVDLTRKHRPARQSVLDLTVIIIAYNEERHIERAIRSAQRIASRIVVVDAYSTDRTVERARRAGADVHQHEFVSHARQFRWAMTHLSIDSEWVMRLDADEVIERDLAENLHRTVPTLDPEITGIELNRKYIFMGRWIRHGGRFPLITLRIWRNGAATIEDRWMDEHMILTQGKTINVPGGFSDVNLHDLSTFISKHNTYATREAVDVILQRRGLHSPVDLFSASDVSSSNKTKRWIKDNLYKRIPLFAGPLFYYLYRMLFQFGFLDGKEGLVYHTLQGLWYRFLVEAKVTELERGLRDCRDPDAVFSRLSKLTGCRLSSHPQTEPAF